ncbi:MAG: hypothetical protein K8H88_33770, partial [Sandaracinaceae bacterium]|nr:hypothetical protein [Sandaracinaceae bacterium]
PESSAQACGDFRDNDCDLQIDCNDVGCCPFIFCDPGTLCGNMARDAGPPPRDSGPAVCGGVEFLDDVLPPACLPRCRASTFTALEACTTAACVDSTLEGDLTPSVQYDLNGMVRELDCAECFGWQLGSCRAQNCPTEYVAYVECVRMTGGACTTQFNAVVACQQSAAVAEDFNTCFDTQVVGGCS